MTNSKASCAAVAGDPSPQPKKGLFIDTAVCQDSNSSTPSSNQFGPPTVTQYGPPTARSYCFTPGTASSRNSTCLQHSATDAEWQDTQQSSQQQQQQQLAQHSRPAASYTGSSSMGVPPHSSRKSARQRVLFAGGNGSSPGSGRPGLYSNAEGTPANHHSAAGEPCSSSSYGFPRVSAVSAGAQTPRGTALLSGRMSAATAFSSSGACGTSSSMAGKTGTCSSSSSPRQARASSVAAGKHYGAWFLPAQDWSYVSKLNPGSTW